MSLEMLAAREATKPGTDFDDFWPEPTLLPPKSSEESGSESTLWPPPETTATADTKTTVVAEESTMTDAMTTKTDSGRTVTVPNSQIVTVTRHTTIVTDKNPPSTSATPLPSSISGQPNQNGPGQTTTTPSAESEPSGASDTPILSTGAIVGVGVGGAVIVAFLVIMAIVIKRRLKKHHGGQDTAATGEDFGRDDRFDEKHFPQQISAHTTGTQASGDPFAPFGGRADQDSEYPRRPPSNTFEMDATSAVPVELPDTSASVAKDRSQTTPSGTATASKHSPGTNSNPADPRANLNSLGNEDGKPKYINHWDQYRAMSSE